MNPRTQLFVRSSTGIAGPGRPLRAAVMNRAMSPLLNVPARFLRGLIWIYQRTFSPALPAMFGPGCGCRFYPSCSHYASEAIARHGAVRGTWLALARLAKCTPLHPGGFDPVPTREARRLRCERIDAPRARI